jgi:hypothetical protein
MTRWKEICAGAATLAIVAGGPALARQQSPATGAECRSKAPAKVDGQVTSVDPAAGTVTIKDKDGTTHEFKTSPETARTMKTGDRIDATLREAPKC